MSVTMTVMPSTTLVRSNQSVPFMASFVLASEGANRLLSAFKAVPSPGPGGFAASIDCGVDADGITLTDNATTFVPFNGVFFANQSNATGDATTQTVAMVMKATIETAAGAPSSNMVGAVISMSVIPEGTDPSAVLPDNNGFPSLDFEDNNNSMLYQGLHFV